MAKRSSPALYELIRHRGGERVPPARSDEADTGSAAPIAPSLRWLRPGRSIQVPAGYLFVVIAAVLFLMVVTYMIAFERGKHAERMVSDGEYGLLAGDDRAGPLFDPLTQGSGASERIRGDAVDSRPRARDQSGVSRNWGPIVSDPRQQGQAYFVLSQARESPAVRLAEFCREHGLETYVVSRHNSQLRRVIALPGIPTDRLASEEAERLRQRIHEIGREWMQAGLGRWDYHEAYLSEY